MSDSEKTLSGIGQSAPPTTNKPSELPTIGTYARGDSEKMTPSAVGVHVSYTLLKGRKVRPKPVTMIVLGIALIGIFAIIAGLVHYR